MDIRVIIISELRVQQIVNKLDNFVVQGSFLFPVSLHSSELSYIRALCSVMINDNLAVVVVLLARATMISHNNFRRGAPNREERSLAIRATRWYYILVKEFIDNIPVGS